MEELEIQWTAGGKEKRSFMKITHIVSLKIQTWVTDYKSTDTAATTDFLLRVIASQSEEIPPHHQGSIQ
jgi:hypothetical protein